MNSKRLRKLVKDYMDNNCHGMPRHIIVEKLVKKFSIEVGTASRFATNWMTYN